MPEKHLLNAILKRMENPDKVGLQSAMGLAILALMEKYRAPGVRHKTAFLLAAQRLQRHCDLLHRINSEAGKRYRAKVKANCEEPHA